MFSSGIMIRIDKTEVIEKQYNEGHLRFSCPANWINYAKNQPLGIADRYEAVFAHVKKDDPRLGMICDDGYPLNYSRSLWNDDGQDGTIYARYVFSCLVPTLCFFSIDIKDAANHFGIKGNSGWWLKADLKSYYNAMGVNLAEYSALIIRFPHLLVNELRSTIPKVIATAKNIDKRDFDENNALAIRYVKYDLDINKEFWDLHPCDELFRKRPQYKDQCEARLIIPNATFMMDPVYRPDLYHDNELIVPVPGLNSYSCIIPATMCSTIKFENFNEDFSRYDICYGDA